MLKFSHSKLIAFSGLIWLTGGVFLMQLGINFLGNPAEESSRPLLNSISPLFGGTEPAAVVLIAIALFVGYFKGRFVLGKTVKRTVERIANLPNPTSLMNIYSFKYYLILGSMVGLGALIKFLNIPLDARGAIDITIGSALINGAMLYFKSAFQFRSQECV